MKDDEGKEDQAGGDGESHGGPDDVDVDFLDSDAEEEDADGDFEDGGSGHIGEFADPPVLLMWLVRLNGSVCEDGVTNPKCQGGVFV